MPMRCRVLTVKIARKLRRIAYEMLDSSEKESILGGLVSDYGIEVPQESDDECLNALWGGLQRLPPALVKDCGITSMSFKDMGPSKKYYPNHGIYSNGTLTLNSRILDDRETLDFDPDSGKTLNKFDQTFFHELGHGWDEKNGVGGLELSLQPDWLSLSGWSQEPKKGLKKLIIEEPGSPRLEGEWWYDPSSGFTRFYAKRNPLDDWADAFSYYVGGLKSFLPEEKVKYFDDRISHYYSN